MNHGMPLTDENKFNRLIRVLKEFLIEASKGHLEQMLISTIYKATEEDEEEESQEEGGDIRGYG